MLVVALAAAIAFGIVWSLGSPPSPQLPADQLLAAELTTDWSAPLDGLMVIAKPARWAGRIAHDPRRQPLVDPAWWGSVDADALGPLPVEPSTVVTAALEVFPTALAVGWWSGGWEVRGPTRATAPLTRVLQTLGRSELMIESVAGITRISPANVRSEDAWSVPAPPMEPTDALACWIWRDQRSWIGRWRGPILELAEPGVEASPIPGSRAALVVHADDLLTTLETAGIRIPRDRWLSVITGEMEGLLAQRATLVLDELEPNDPIPKPRIALILPWWDDRSAVVARTRSALCPVGARVQPARLDNGIEAQQWRSSLVTWWAVEHHEGLVVASGKHALLTGLEVAEQPLTSAESWWTSNGPRLAQSLQAVGHAHLLADLGVLSRTRLEELRRVAGPLAGIRQISWQRTPTGEVVHVRLE